MARGENRRKTMVKISIYAEGPDPNHNAMSNAARTMSNSVRLRYEFNRILTEASGRDDISIDITFAGGYKATLKRFSQNNDIDYAFSDSECAVDHSNRDEWFINNLESEDNPEKNIIISKERKDDVFLMIQAMETWFLKQPEAIERWALDKGYTHKEGVPLKDRIIKLFKDDTLEESINGPKIALKTLLSQCFAKNEIKRNGKVDKKVRYSETMSAPEIMSHLNVAKLVDKDLELQRFKGKLSNI